MDSQSAALNLRIHKVYGLGVSMRTRHPKLQKWKINPPTRNQQMGVTYHCGDRFAFGVFSVGYSISDDIFKENFQHAACLFVNETGNSLNSATACQTSDCGFGNALDVVAQHFPPFPRPVIFRRINRRRFGDKSKTTCTGLENWQTTGDRRWTLTRFYTARTVLPLSIQILELIQIIHVMLEFGKENLLNSENE